MAKNAVPGRVKTRLCSQFTAVQAAAIHEAMLHCTLVRVAAALSDSETTHLILSLDETAEAARIHPPEPWNLIDQGNGDLGQRLAYVWRRTGCGPTIFLGCDSPDVPTASLRTIWPALRQTDVVLGPVNDGGYWTIASRQFDDRLFDGVDWGSADVYHQTRRAAEKAAANVVDVAPWHDVDTPDDLDALRQRLARAGDTALARLRSRLDDLCEGRAR